MMMTSVCWHGMVASLPALTSCCYVTDGVFPIHTWMAIVCGLLSCLIYDDMVLTAGSSSLVLVLVYFIFYFFYK